MKWWLRIRLNNKDFKGRKFYTSCLYLLYLSFSSFIVGCSTKSDPVPAIIKELKFPIRPAMMFSQLYLGKEFNQEVFCFFKNGDEKSLELFDSNTNLLKTIPLSDVIKKIDNIGGVYMLSLDTIIINSNYTNQIVVINSTGKIWKHLNLESKLVDSLGNQYELSGAVCSVNQKSNQLLYRANWRSNVNDELNATVPRNRVEHCLYFNQHVQTTPYFLSLTRFFSDSVNVQFKFNGFYTQIEKEIKQFGEIPSHFLIGESAYITSMYSNKIFKVNRTTFKLEKIIDIQSKHTSIGAKPLTIKKEYLDHSQDSITYICKSAGRIEQFLYHADKSCYYVVVRHNATVSDYDKRKICFSIIVLNKALEQTHEYVFDDFKYIGYGTLLTSEGLLLLKNDTTKKLIKDDKITFSLVNLPE
jgi:hypothetical protein